MSDLPRGWKPNARGECPGIARGHRVKVKLRCGRIESGWPADASAGAKGPPTDWSLRGSPADVLEWDFA